MATRPRVVNAYSAQWPPPRRLAQLTTRSAILLTCMAVIVLFGSSHLFLAPPSHRGSRARLGSSAAASNGVGHRCRLARAFSAGEFRVFSHRTFHDDGQSVQPACRDSLERLRSIGVTHLDLDLVLAEEEKDAGREGVLVVAHPMEWKRESSYYSPCANQKFDDLVGYLKDVYRDEDWFISLEPKASWNNSPRELSDPALADSPSSILQVLLTKVRQHNLKGHCAAIQEVDLLGRGQRGRPRTGGGAASIRNRFEFAEENSGYNRIEELVRVETGALCPEADTVFECHNTIPAGLDS
ncbi:hypothetical protein THAOC_33359 [Thalassiosira oceanica]|uniref:Uncharacterized protein n=1 Tax=Thalassiosira oceanica TaxID=159749 RepID=K0RFZ2_THAOC|nr:hypothetical protein THAOC_33359 [Thalassiosira oceanica]|eukprot:EJK47891.1 hypothetical protein THAOC_33359 [Thalassiosira oceanica]